MTRIQIVLLAAVLTCVGFGGQERPSIGIIDFYGLRQVSERQVRQALGVQEGDAVPMPVGDLRRRLTALPGVVDASVEAVCCDDGKSILYVGIAEQNTSIVTFRPAPQGSARLPADVRQAGESFEAAFEKAIQRGDFAEDHSKGHALMHDADARTAQERFVAVEAAHDPILRQVLRESGDAEQRALAAQILGYAVDKRTVISDLVAAMTDADKDVRNNATRALWVIAEYAQQSPSLGIRVPTEPFVYLLNSLIWQDRNKSSLALAALSTNRPPELLESIRSKALPSIVEMARWKSRGHAEASVLLLGRIAGIAEETLQDAVSRGDFGHVIDEALKRLETK
jgi:hypothetical protein